MAKFTTSSAVGSSRSRKNTPSVKTTNAAGGTGYTQSAKMELASLLLTSFLQDEKYRSASATQTRLKELVAAVDPVFAAKAAVFARKDFGMRSISHAAAVALAADEARLKGLPWMVNFFDKVVNRPDDVTEILALYMLTYKDRPIKLALRRGLGKALARFDEYRLAKYRGENHAFKLVDAVNLVRPQATKALNALMKGTLKSADTWETKLTAAGQTNDAEEKADAKAAAWKSLLEDEKLGYLAALRNVRNIAEQADAASAEKLAELLTDREHIRKARIFPFQILSAYDAIAASGLDSSKKRKLLGTLSDALDISLENVPVFEGDAAVLLDTSGSMGGYDQANSPARIGSIFAAALAKAWNADLVSWASDASFVTFNPRDSVMSIAKGIPFKNGGTNLSAAFNALTKRYGRVVVLSDMQTWQDGSCGAQPSWSSYQRRTGCKPHLYSFDLKNYGTLAIPENKVYCLAGYSDKVFEIMGKLEQDQDALVKAIEAVKLD